MTVSISFAEILASRIREEQADLVSRWQDRVSARVNLDPDSIFPAEKGPEPVCVLLSGIADYVEDPAAEVSANGQLLSMAGEHGSIRHAQGFESHQILKEFEILGGVLYAFAGRIADENATLSYPQDVLACSHRLFRGIAVVEQTSMATFMRLSAAAASARETQLRSFSRAIAHEVRNRLSALRGAVDLMDESFVLHDEISRRRFLKMAGENIDAIERTTRNLIEISRVEAESGTPRNVLLREAIFEVVRQLRHHAEDRGVRVLTSPEVPVVEVPASAVELALANYLSNAIKYSDPKREDRRVQIRAWLVAGQAEVPQVAVAVLDNGIGVPVEARHQLFTPFFRAGGDTVPPTEGTGLGLSLVRETIEGIGGRVWAEMDRSEETVFAFSVPCRELGDEANR